MKSLFLIVLVACKSSPAEPDGVKADPQSNPTPPPPPAAPKTDDPKNGKFSLEDATAGLGGTTSLEAVIEVPQGKLVCKLYDDKAPITVANFVGLARGVRPWKDPQTKTWVTRPAYDGTTFHRIIKGFMIQGGDANGDGSGEAGYVIPDEVWTGAAHDRAGLLCMANRGKNTNSAQFFITDAAARHLDKGYTIFGECGPESLIHTLASVPVNGEKPITPVAIQTITIRRGGAGDGGSATDGGKTDAGK